MIGRPEYHGINTPLEEMTRDHRPAIMVHRGSGRGTIVENTCKGITAALVEGADIVEIDIVASTDGDFFLFHDGYEPAAFGVSENITTFNTEQVENLNYGWANSTGRYPVERLSTVLEQFPDTFFNVDRSWRWWPQLLDYLAEHGSVGHLLLKSPMLDQAIAALAAHPSKFPYIPIVKTPEDVERITATPGLNTVGFELIAPTQDHPFCDSRYVAHLQDRGYLVQLNAINLADQVPLFGGYDDETSMLGDPDGGWGVLVEMGADLIQTDWPSTLEAYLAART